MWARSKFLRDLEDRTSADCKLGGGIGGFDALVGGGVE